MSTFSKRERLHKAQKQLQYVLDNLLKLSTDCDIRRLVKDHNIKSVLDLIDLCQLHDWGRDLDITTSVSRPILEDQCMLLMLELQVDLYTHGLLRITQAQQELL